MSDPHQPDFWGPRERAEEARTLLGSPIYGMALKALREEYVERLQSLPLSSPDLVGVHAKLKVLDEIGGKLQSYVSDYQFRAKREIAA